MVVISDTSILTNLFQIGLLYLIGDIYGRVIIPTSVAQELLVLDNQKAILDQNWLEIVSVRDKSRVSDFMKSLHRGEAEAIALALDYDEASAANR